MRYKKNKKGIEMSINIIVMLVIGLTILGLVISFVTNLLGDATNKFSTKLNSLEEADRKAALDASGIFIVKPSSVEIKRGEKRRIFVKFKNTDDKDVLTIEKIQKNGDSPSEGEFAYSLDDVIGSCSKEVEIKSSKIEISPGEEEVVPVSVIIPTSCDKGDSFSLSLKTKLKESIKTSFVDVEVGE